MYKALQAALVATRMKKQHRPRDRSAYFRCRTVMEFNDLETIRIDRLSLADNPTVQIKSEPHG